MKRLSLMVRLGSTLIGLVVSLGGGALADDVVAVVSAGSPVTTLSRNQAVDIFLGRSNRFPDGTRAVPIDQVEGSATRDVFYASFAGMSATQIKAHWSKIIFTGRGLPPRALPSGKEVIRLIADNPNAIGYVEPNVVNASVRVLVVQ